MNNLQELVMQVPACEGCQLGIACSHKAVDNKALDPKVFLIGGLPPADIQSGDLRSSQYAYRILWALADWGIPSSAVYFTSITKCSGQPDYEQMRTCMGWLSGEVRAARPTLTVTTDLFAFEVLTGQKDWPPLGKPISCTNEMVKDWISRVWGVLPEQTTALWRLAWHKISQELSRLNVLSDKPIWKPPEKGSDIAKFEYLWRKREIQSA